MQQPKRINIQALHKLSVLIHQDGLCFYIYDRDGAVVQKLAQTFKHALNPIELLDEIQNLYNKEYILQQEFASFSLVYHHDIFAIVPDALYNEETAPDYLKYNTRLLKTDVVSVDEPIAHLEARCVYIAYSNLNNYFHDVYGAFEYNHYSTSLLTSLTDKAKEQQYTVYLTIEESYFYLTLFKNGVLVLHNIYPQEAPEDVLYYTMFATSHNGFDPEVMDVTIIQDSKNQATFDLLYTYIRNLSYLENSSTFLTTLLCA